MPMTLEQLIKLYILQKDHHQTKAAPSRFFAVLSSFGAEYSRLLPDASIIKEDMMAPPLFAEQPKIPFVLLKPQNATPTDPKPLIIHTHGGPNVYMDKDKLHAEIAYFLSLGYVVACPNYRGSTGYPSIGDDMTGWSAWREKSKDKHHIYGPEDVYTVTKYMQAMPFVDPTRIFLRGCSFGSFINAHLLVGIKKGLFDNIFKGAHLSGGVKYPVATAMPVDVPLLITHSVADDIAPFSDARLFMEKMLLKHLANTDAGIPTQSIQIFIAKKGDHHLIDPALTLSDESSTSFHELVQYLEHTTGFITALSAGESYERTAPYLQYLEVMSDRVGALEIHEDLKLSEDESYEPTAPYHDFPGGMSDRVAALAIHEDVRQRVKAYQHVFHREKQPDITAQKRDGFELDAPTVMALPTPKEKSFYGPSMALLKLHLGDSFTGDIKTDLTTYLLVHFSPIDWSSANRLEISGFSDIRPWSLFPRYDQSARTQLTLAGKTICDNREFIDQMALVIQKEESFLAHHPDHMVLYHSADNNTLQLYTFINLWKNILTDLETASLPIIEDMRLYDFMKQTFEDIEIFLLKMRGIEKPDGVFNNISAFSKRAIACNPSIISNAHSTASCSLWWYFNAKDCDRVPVSAVLKEMLEILGIYSPERLSRYVHLFEREKQRLDAMPQSLLQQIFIPYEIAERSAYMCQIWGEEFTDNTMTLKSPSVIQSLVADPTSFEHQLRANKSAFTNFGDCEGFGEVDHGFNYANTLQLRYLPRNDPSIVTYSYFRSEEAHRHLVSELSVLIREDFADYLAYGTAVPDFIIKGANRTQHLAGAITCSAATLFAPKPRTNYEAFYIQQRELHKQLVQNPRQEIYGGIIALSSQDKLMLQERLRSAEGIPRGYSLTYSLCQNLKGYTYYDFLSAAARSVFLKDDAKTSINYDFIMKMIDAYSIPSSVNTAEGAAGHYQRLYDLMQCIRREYKYKPEVHQFFKPAPHYREDYLFAEELAFAIESILKFARLAKEKAYGRDVSHRLMSFY